MGPEQKTFQRRARRVKDDGGDFEDFVFECFSVARQKRGFSKRLARGRDGAIDLIDRLADPGAATVAECKYIGSGRADDALARWRDVFANLKSNLPALAADPAKRAGSPYRAWLDPDRPVTRYRFCVTAAMRDVDVVNLEKQIVGDFATLAAAGVPQLRALSEEPDAVRVLPWDWFHAAIVEHPSLGFRWFRGLPQGVELFAAQQSGEATFRDFLNSGQLRYFSRDEYGREGIGTVKRGETELIQHLAGADGSALLITGPGGVGKTRLSFHIAEEMGRAGHDFDVYRLGRSANGHSVEQLAASYPGAASILLIVDYAEAVPKLAEIADALNHVASNSGHRLRLVATCRASAVNQVKDHIGVLPFEEKSLSSVRTGEKDYAQWVTNSILRLEPLPQRSEIERVCHGVPALAAFAIFLFRGHRSQFDAQFGALHAISDFDNWVRQRMSLLTARFGGDVSISRTLARIALALPLQTEVYEAIGAESDTARALLRTMVDDCWMEREGNDYFAAHDILADALVARWMLETDHVATERALDLLQDAARHDRLNGALVALDRLALHPKLADVDGPSLASVLFARHTEQAVRCSGNFLSGALLGFEGKLALLHSCVAFKNALCDPLYDVGLSLLADEAVRRKLKVTDRPGLATLIALLDQACRHVHTSNMVLRRAYALDPERFRERALRDIAAYPRAEPTHFMIVQMLRSREPANTLEEAVRVWVESNPVAACASFLYSAWLGARGAVEVISAPAKAWIAVHGKTPEAQFVYTAWLNAKGPVEPIRDPLAAWIDRYGQTGEARSVYEAWLNAHQPYDAIAAPLLAWVHAYADVFETQYVYAAWLDALAPPEAIRGPLLSWIGSHGERLEAHIAYTAWMYAGGALAAVSQPVRKWIERHGQALDAHLVYAAWLNAGGTWDAVAAPMLQWIERHGDKLEAQGIYSAWLSAGGSIETVSAKAIVWMTKHGEARQASHIYRAWFNRGADFAPVRDHVFAWMIRWRDDPDAAFVNRHLCKRKDLSEAVILAIAEWCAAFSEHPDGVDRLATLMPHATGETLSDAGFFKLISLAEDVVTTRVASGQISDLHRARLWAIVASLAHESLLGFNPHGCVRSAATAIRSKQLFVRGLSTNGADFLHETYARMSRVAILALRWGELSVEQDRGALRIFNDWLRAVHPPVADLTRLERLSNPP